MNLISNVKLFRFNCMTFWMYLHRQSWMDFLWTSRRLSVAVSMQLSMPRMICTAEWVQTSCLHRPSHTTSSIFVTSPSVFKVRYVLAILLLQADPGNIRESKQIFRLFCHEALRVFHDRLISVEDKTAFYAILVEMASKYFAEVRVQLDVFVCQSSQILNQTSLSG